ncbi:xanthine dehydrogenase small subunit [Brevibacterium linens]|uniref:Xanthine dehydrogenase small subunit n=1 Tax=Brevibacterium linens ATCC 9172 TaxID=1255617 RepID=A0A2H1IKU3_BRELN|nr:FAD binding domain-containing protein [Brevibacterium linens]KAB1948297.1 2Fe-2S iron-sulfur cluster binding domain-containing protein [Brevibacterium linens ATCC 9172]SMX75798.1 xanthine dehydrogenase small subunit [Brevibacterium linens ATCC 9172]
MSAATTDQSTAEVTINGTVREFDGPPHTNALDFLRGQGLTGAKEGCAEGECGACAIMVARPDESGGTRWTSVNSCLLPAAALDGGEVVTSEGLADGDTVHPVQEEMAVRGGSQCGYCTPGFISSMAAEYYRPDRCEDGFDLHSLSGNLCRCTGYRPIRDAANALGQPTADDALAARRDRPAPAPVATDYQRADTATGRIGRYRRPATLAEATSILSQDPEVTVVAGATDWGVEVNIKGARAKNILAVDRLEEMRGIRRTESFVELGASHTLSELERELNGSIPLLGKLFPQFASRLIRNGATIGGNLGTGSPIGDTPPALLALEAELVLTSVRGSRTVALADYFTGYRQTVRASDELITAIRIPLPLSPLTSFQKIAKRRFDDISSVAIGYAVDIRDGMIAKARIGLGGVAATPLRATATEALLEGRPWSLETVHAAAETLAAEGTPMDDHRASAKYRTAMLRSSLERFYAEQLGHPAVTSKEVQ